MERAPDTLEAESHIRGALGKIGVKALQAVLQAWVDNDDTQRPTPDGMVREGRRNVWVRSQWGDFQIRRAYYTGPEPGQGDAPGDRLLGLWNSYTPATAKILSKLSAQLPFESAAMLLAEVTGASINGRQFQRFIGDVAQTARDWLRTLKPPRTPPHTLYVSFDGTGVPMRKEHLAGHKGRARNGCAQTREMRLGCVFTQSAVDHDGNAIRDPHSTTYVAAIAPHRIFGGMVKDEAVRRGMRQAQRVVLISDGANWCQSIAEWEFSGHIHILDFYHAAEHVHDLAKAIFGDSPETEQGFLAWREKLYEGKAQQVIDEAKAMRKQAKHPKDFTREISYLQRNRSRMRYQQFRQQGLFIGSGVIEAGCKNVVGKRAKQSGMFWAPEGVQNVLTLRCLMLSGRIDTFFRNATHLRDSA